MDKIKIPNLIIEGREVETVIFPDEFPYASNAEFNLINNAPTTRMIELTAVQFFENGHITHLEIYYLYAESNDLNKVFPLQANSDLSLVISFPFISVRAGMNDIYEVIAKFKCEGIDHKAKSQLIFTFEEEN